MISAAKKLRSDIIEILFKIDDVKILKSIHRNIQNRNGENEAEKLPFVEAVKPVRKEVALEEIMANQNYQPVTYQQFRAKADEMLWEESLDELLSALSK